MPITTTREGINAVSKLILYPHKYITATVHTTPITTTLREINVVLIDLKNRNKINTLNASEPNKNNFISF